MSPHIRNPIQRRGGMSLTPRQRELMLYLTRCGENAPSFGEMCAAINSHSRQTVFDLLTSLEERGYIKREYGKARSIQILNPLPIMIEGQRFQYVAKGVGG